jgi:cytochrome c553
LAISAAAADVVDGKQKAATCVACHGENGISPNDMWPNIAGQKKQYFIKQVKSFRDGERIDPLMSSIARMLSDEDIESLAVYYSQMEPGK